MGKWFKKEESGEEQGFQEQVKVPGSLAGGGWRVEEQEESGSVQGQGTESGRGCLGKGLQSRGRGGRLGLEPREQEVREEQWLVVCLVLLSEVQQWFGCNIRRPENMEAGFGEEEHQE